MGGYDVFCPFCGVVAKDFDTVSGHGERLDMHLLGDDGGDWISDVHLIGVNENSRSVDKAYITGLASFWDYGYYYVNVGDHPNFPSDQEPLTNGKIQLRTYGLEDDPVTFPYHQVCFEHMFSRVLHWACKDLDGTGDYGIWRNFNLEALHSSLSSLCRADAYFKLSLDYGAISDRQGQYVQYCKGDEEFAANPISGAALSQYFSNLPRLRQSNAHPARLSLGTQEFGSHSDHLSNLPLELLIPILLHLPPKDIQSLRASSRAIHSLTLSNEYWFQRIAIDLPFLFDRPRRNDLEATEMIDWCQVHKDLSNLSSRESTPRVVGLISRRRIWMVCENIVDVYLDQVRKSQKASMPEAKYFIGDVVSPRVPKVAWPNVPDYTHFRKFLYKDFDSMVPGRTVVTAYWNDRCLLSNIRFSTDDKVIYLVDPKLLADNLRGDSFDLSDADWIERLELILADIKSSDSSLTRGGVIGIIFHTSRSRTYEVGITDVSKSYGVPIQYLPYRRSLKTSDGYLLVGLQGDYADGTIHRLGILEQRLTTISVPTVDTQKGIQQYMWLDCAPADQTMLGKLQYGYWSRDCPLDTTAMEIGLRFGTFSEKVASIAGDLMLGGFELGCPPRGMGPVRMAGPKRQAMKTLTLDGENGERVIQVETKTTCLPQMIRFVTNKGRQLILGWPDGQDGTILHPPPDGHVISGVFCSWNYSARAELTNFGVIFTPSHDIPEERVEPSPQLLDSAGRYWEPCSPPQGWLEDGPITGAGGDVELVRPSNTIRKMPKATIVSWLDFKRPLETIRLWSSHPYGFAKDLSLVGIVFEYSDGSRSSAGMDSEARFIQPQNKYDWSCPCRRYAKEIPDAEWPSEHHWYSDSWHPDGEPITGVRVWSGLVLEGIQFIPKVGRESPIWGKCKGAPCEIMFGGSNACGLKLFMGSNNRPVSDYVDMVIMAVQALKDSSAEGRPS